MQLDARSYLWDALTAAETAQMFVRGKTYFWSNSTAGIPKHSR
jgi:hypothetical protein